MLHSLLSKFKTFTAKTAKNLWPQRMILLKFFGLQKA